MKAVSVGAAFLVTASNTSAYPPLAEAPQPQTPEVVLPPPPPPDPVFTAVEDLRKSFLHRVAAGEQTTFNSCFTRAKGGISNVGLIRLVWTKPRTDYMQPPIVVLDRGHGHEAPGTPYGYDTGAIRGDVIEAKVVDAVSEKVRETLEREGVKVVETRGSVDDGVGLSEKYRFRDQERALQWRSEISYQLSAKFPERPVIFLSLHANTASGSKLAGAEVFYYSGAGAGSSSSEFARSIGAQYQTPTGNSAIKSANFGVLRCQNENTPAVLLELGFLTNANDRSFLRGAMTNEDKAQDVADMVVAGIADFVEKKQRAQRPKSATIIANNDAVMRIQ